MQEAKSKINNSIDEYLFSHIAVGEKTFQSEQSHEPRKTERFDRQRGLSYYYQLFTSNADRGNQADKVSS
jgi:hypothetical protein